MGGHADGAVAAGAAVDAVVSAFEGADARVAPARFLESALQAAHAQVMKLGDGIDLHQRPRTTCVAAIVRDGNAWFAHAGDSRAYVLRDGAVIVQTRDHSQVEDLVAAGEIDEAERHSHPMRHMVDRCLGGESPPVDLTQGGPHALEAGDVVLLCSDGFWDAIDIEQAARELCGTTQLVKSAERLVEMACTHAAPAADNATVAVLRMGRT